MASIPAQEMFTVHRSGPVLDFRVFGSPRLLLNQREIPFRRRQPLAVIAILALSAHPCSRDELIYLLWPDAPQDTGRQRLRRVLSVIRQAVGPIADQLLLRVGSGNHLLHVDQQECRVDAWTFLQLAQQAHSAVTPDNCRLIEQALRLSAEPLLSGLEHDASAEFEQWVFQQRDRFARIRSDLWRQLVDGYALANEVHRAISTVERALVVDPIAEDLHRKAMWLYARAGRRTDAIQQYVRCTALLARELNIEPEADTLLLYQAILADHIDEAFSLAFSCSAARVPSVATTPQHRGLPSFPWPDDSFRVNELLTTMQQAINGSSTVLCLQGPAGAGKTRLVRLALEQMRQRMPDISIWLSSARKTGHETPFGLITDLFNVALQDTLSRTRLQTRQTPLSIDLRMTEALCLLPELRALFAALPPLQPTSNLTMPSVQMAQRRLLQAVPRALRALQGEAPVVIVLEDLDQADPLSIEASGWLLRALHDSSRLILIITCRTTDGELAAMFDQLQAREQVPIWHLPAFDRTTVHQIAERLALPASLAETVWHQTHGMPLATRELLYAATLHSVTGEASIPASLAEALLSHFRSLNAVTRQVLEAAAILNSGNIMWLHHVSGRTVEEVERACNELIAGDWLTQVDTWYVIAHPEMRTVVEQQLTTARRQLLHRQSAELLRQHNADPFRIAAHLAAADLVDEAAAMWFRAASHAQARYAQHAALIALQHGLRLATDHQLRFNLLSKQETILHENGLRSEQETVLAALEHLVEQSPDYPEWRAEIYRKRGRLALVRNQWAAAVDALRRAATLTLYQDDETLCLLARALTHAQQWDEASAIAQRAIALAQQQSNRDALVRAWLALADVEQAREHYDAAETALKQTVQIAGKASPMVSHLMLALGNLAAVRNDFHSALIYGQEARQLFAQRGLPDSEASASALVARMLVRLQRLDEAVTAYQSAYAAYAALELRQGMAACCVNACTLVLRLGWFEQGIELAQEAYELFQSINDARGMCVAASNIGAALTWMGCGAEAEEWLRESYQRAVAIGLPAQQAAAQANLGAALLQQGQLIEARQLMEAGLALRATQGHLDVSIDRAFLAIVCLRLGDIDAAEQHSAQALVDVQRTPQIEHPQQVWFARAQVLRQQGKHDEARAVLAIAVDCLHQVESQLPATQRQHYRTVFFFNRALLEAWLLQIWPDPPALI